MDYIDKPDQRGNIRDETERFINRQFRGAMLDELPESDVQALIANYKNSPGNG
jgi:hypothetical protein